MMILDSKGILYTPIFLGAKRPLQTTPSVLPSHMTVHSAPIAPLSTCYLVAIDSLLTNMLSLTQNNILLTYIPIAKYVVYLSIALAMSLITAMMVFLSSGLTLPFSSLAINFFCSSRYPSNRLCKQGN